MAANYRGSFGSSPAWPNSGARTPNPLTLLSRTPTTTVNASLSPEQCPLWIDAAAASVAERTPLFESESSSGEEEGKDSDSDPEEQLLPRPQAPTVKSHQKGYLNAVVNGLIVTIIMLPVIGAFAEIIFKDKFFDRYLPSLTRHMFLSCAIQQSIMSVKSSLPFAIGQIQDIGLFFMATLASAVVKDELPDNPTDDDRDFVMGAVIFILTFSAVFVGTLVMLVSLLRLAGLVQYVPLPVIGGYLGYLGYYLMISGAFISTNTDSDGFKSYPDLFDVDGDWWHSRLFKVFIGIACFLFIHAFVSIFNHPASLPAALLFIPAAFYICLFLSGASLDEVRHHGWLSDTSGNESDSETFFSIWGLINFGEVQNYFHLIPAHLKTLFPLFVLVVFGSCLDIAAIQQEYLKEIDFNKELGTVGLQNVAAGISCVGYTGSYIFSGTLFCLRNGVNSRIAGYILVAVETLLFLVPFSPANYIPKFYLGSLAIWIGYGIFMDWLVYSRTKVSLSEYVLMWITFFCVLVFDLTYGLLLGALLSMLVFIFLYARSNIAEIRIIPSKRCVVKTVEQRTILEKFHNNMVAIGLSGYIFFGSSVEIGKRLSTIGIEQRKKLVDSLEECEELVRAAISDSPLVIIVDMRLVKGLDATAARTMGVIRRSLAAEGINMFIANLDDHQKGIRKLLEAHKAILFNGDDTVACDERSSQDCHSGTFFTSTDAAVSFCEDMFLNAAVRHGLCRRDNASPTFAEVLRSHLDNPQILAQLLGGYRSVSSALSAYVRQEKYRKGDYLFRMDDPSDQIFIVGKGRISLETRASGERRQVLEYGPGGVLGDCDFYLRRARSFDALSTARSEVWTITRDAFERMISIDPNAAICMQLLILHSSALSAVGVLQLLGRAQDRK